MIIENQDKLDDERLTDNGMQRLSTQERYAVITYC